MYPNWEESEKIVGWDQDDVSLVSFTTENGQRWFAFPIPDGCQGNDYIRLQGVLRKVIEIETERRRLNNNALNMKRIDQAISNLQAMANLGGCSDHPEIEEMAAVTADLLNSVLQHQGVE